MWEAQRKRVRECLDGIVAESEPASSPPNVPSREIGSRRRRLASLVLVLSVWAAYAVSLDGEFVYDDLIFTHDNAAVKGPFSLARIFCSSYYQGDGYRPLVVLSFALDYRLHRLQTRGFHATNLLIHSINVLLIFALLTRLLGDERTAFLGALLFAVHPVHAEVVANIAQRTASLAALCYLLGWLAWLRGGKAGMGLAMLAYLVGLLCKEEAVTLPGALLLGDFLLGRLSDRRAWFNACARYSAFMIPLAIYLLVRVNAIGNLDASTHLYFNGSSWLTVALTMARFSVSHYLPGLLAGANLSWSHARPSIADASPADPFAWMEAALLLVGVLGVGIHFARRRSPIAFGAAFALLTLLPASNLLFRIWAIGAQRYLYLPSLGYCLAVAVALREYHRRARAAQILACLLVAGYFAATVVEAGEWRTGLRLFTRVVERTPDNPTALHGLADIHRAQGDLQGAIELYKRCVLLNPDRWIAEINIGSILTQLGQAEEGLERMRRVQDRVGPIRELPWLAMVSPLLMLGRIAEARECAQRAFALVPESSRAWLRLADVSLAEGKPPEAEADYRRCLELDPDNTDAAQQLAALLRNRSEFAASRDVLTSVLEGVPEFATGWNDLGISLDQLNQSRGAEDAYRRALEIWPDWGVPSQNLGILLLKNGRVEEAGDLFQRAIERMPSLLEAKVSLGIVRARQDRRAEAAAVWKDFLQAAGSDPRYAAAAKFVRAQLAALELKK